MATILLVEDDTVLREGLLELFIRDGYQVISAGSLRSAQFHQIVHRRTMKQVAHAALPGAAA